MNRRLLLTTGCRERRVIRSAFFGSPMASNPHSRSIPLRSGRQWPLVWNWLARRDRSGGPVAWFSASYYQAQAGESAGSNPWEHFARHGWKQGFDPHPWFDVEHYLSQVGSLESVDPVTHFIDAGWQQGIDPHPLFDVSRYLSAVGDLEGLSDPLTHYLVAGASHGVAPHPLIDLAYIRRLHRSSWTSDPMTGLLARGMNRQFRCHPLFSCSRLRLRQRFLEGVTAPEWSHRERVRRWVNWNSKLSPSPLFDPDFYLARYPQAASYPGGALQHFIQVGQYSDFDPNPYFCSAFYRDRYGDRLGDRSPFMHYMTFERTLKFDPCEQFDVSHYVSRHRTPMRWSASPLEHFLDSDRYRGAEISPNRLPSFLAQQLNEARSVDPSFNLTLRELPKLPHVNRHRSVRGIRVFRDLIDQLETGFSVLILVGGSEPDPALVELVTRLVNRRDKSETLVLATDSHADAWRRVLPRQTRCVSLESASLEELEERTRIALTQHLIEEDRPDFTVLVDSSIGWDLVAIKGQGLRTYTRFWGVVDPSSPLRNQLTTEPIGTARGAAWEFCEGAVIAKAHADDWMRLEAVCQLPAAKRSQLQTLIIDNQDSVNLDSSREASSSDSSEALEVSSLTTVKSLSIPDGASS